MRDAEKKLADILSMTDTDIDDSKIFSYSYFPTLLANFRGGIVMRRLRIGVGSGSFVVILTFMCIFLNLTYDYNRGFGGLIIWSRHVGFSSDRLLLEACSKLQAYVMHRFDNLLSSNLNYHYRQQLHSRPARCFRGHDVHYAQCSNDHLC